VEPAQLICFSARTLREILEEDPPVGVRLMWNLAQILNTRLRETKGEVDLLKTIIGQELQQFPGMLGSSIRPEDKDGND
jgi:CRP-like cAMP-binding protein